MLFNTSLVAQVGYGESAGSNQRCLRMVNTKREKEIIRMNYQGPILSVKLNRQRLVVVLETIVYIYDIANMHLTHTIAQTPRNPKGVCALASYNNLPADTPGNHSFFAYPGSDNTGLVYIYDVANLQPVTNVEAHTSTVACLALSPGGDRLATASQRGTVIRVFGLPKGEPLFEFRRGSSPSHISSMSFSVSNPLLLSTVYISMLNINLTTILQINDVHSQTLLLSVWPATVSPCTSLSSRFRKRSWRRNLGPHPSSAWW